MFDLSDIHTSTSVTVVVEFDKARSNSEITTQTEMIFNSEEIIKYYKESGIFTRRQIEEDFGVTIHKARSKVEEMVRNKLIVKEGTGAATYYRIMLG